MPRSSRTAAVLIVLAVLAAGCGTRVPRNEALRVLRGESGGAVRAGAAIDGTGPDSAESAEAESVTAQRTGGAEGSSTQGGTSRATAASGGADKKPIRIGMNGNWTGIIGQSLAPARDSYAAWVKMVNSRGGVNGHPIELLIADDGGDATRSLSNVKDLVENRHVLAIVNLFVPTGADRPITDYVQKMGVPVVGGYAIDDIWMESPMLFSAVTSNKWRSFAPASAVARTGIKKVGVVYCTEVDVCRTTADGFKGGARELGLEVAYEGSYSLAQPDFTAQCLQAQGKADAIFISGDYASGNRMAQSCARQGYKPVFVLPSPSNNVVPEIDGALGTVTAFPWMLVSGSPALQEYGDAVTRYASGPVNAQSAVGWVNGKLLERALANIPDAPTSRDIFEGLWTMRGDTLGGLTPPLTFNRDQAAAEVPCWFEVKLSNGKWAPTAGTLRPVCKPGS